MKAIATLLLLPGIASAASFTPIADYPYFVVEGISADGSAIVGWQGTPQLEAVRWNETSGGVALGDLPGGAFKSVAKASSIDGAVVVGYSTSTSPPSYPAQNQLQQAFRWTETDGMVGLGGLPGEGYSVATGVSDNGSVIVGYSRLSPDVIEAFVWTPIGGMVGIGEVPGGKYDSRAFAVSADGSVIVGGSNSANGSEAFRWTAAGGMVALGGMPGASVIVTEARAVSADGNTIVGVGYTDSDTRNAFRWTETEGMISLGALVDGSNSDAIDVSADGAVIVGLSGPAAGVVDAFVWTEADGMQRLFDILVGYGVSEIDGWTELRIGGISADGTIVAGSGLNPTGINQVFIANIEAPSPVPTPPAAWLFGSALGVMGWMRRKVSS